MSQHYAATDKFTTLEGKCLADSMAAVAGAAVVATVNEDGTPNAAVFVPMMADDDHVVMTLAPNRTRENIERTGECVLVYEEVDARGASKAERYRGARLRLELLREGDPRRDEALSGWPRVTPYTMAFLVVERMPIG
ncbi:pyridoxamine 5'-phosphate oxidase family protein [uncultured Slackia sp.]|uniref:pyridoxamine 5'-phosphate oxidase family protein n=1 Tax=uncultured Slackia sp. TaxID=665903 RepID=UPI0026E0F8EB|nr:pyridoxamine 5'-phosphate oxidase family protein [uncultured Slackia sp.]